MNTQENYSTLEAADGYNDQTQKEVRRSSWEDLPQPLYQNPAVQPDHIYKGPQPDQSTPQRRICGLATRTFWIVAAAVALGLVGAIVGGAVGGVLANRSKKSSQSDAPNPDSSNTTTRLLTTSKVAAVNWTDEARFTHYAVFAQDDTNSLLVSLWDSQNQTWSATNISDATSQAESPIKAKSGTPLAAVSAVGVGPNNQSAQMNLYFLTPSNIISEVVSQDGRSWRLGDLPKTAPRTVDEDSALAAVWHRCKAGCTENVYVAYLSDGQCNSLNSTDWSEANKLVNVDSGSPLTLFPMIGFQNETHGTGLVDDLELRLYFTNDKEVDEFKYGVEGDWVYGNAIQKVAGSGPLPQLAGAPFDSWFQILLLSLDSDGSLSGHWWNNERWATNQNINLRNAPSNTRFTAIAQHHERHLYSVVDGVIQEYRWEKEDPLSMLYVGEVDLE